MATRKNPCKGLFKVRSKGRDYYYAWRNGPRIEAEFGSEAFLEEFLAARSPMMRLDRSRLGAWVALYKASEEFAGLAPSTHRVWHPWLDRIQEHFGNLSLRQFDRPQIRVDIRKWRDRWRSKPRTADYAKQVLSRVLAYAVADGALSLNHCEGIPNLYQNNRADIIWTDEEFAALLAVASKEIAWAAKLAMHTGLRQGDLLRLSWSHIEDNAITIKTGKSRGRSTATIPITQSLRALLSEIPKRATTVLTNSERLPWKRGFASSWNTTMHRAGLSGRNLHFHDLRGNFATVLYRADFTMREIADILGWSQDKVERLIDRYVKRDELLRDRIRRLEQFENENRKTDSKTQVKK